MAAAALAGSPGCPVTVGQRGAERADDVVVGGDGRGLVEGPAAGEARSERSGLHDHHPDPERRHFGGERLGQPLQANFVAE
jgi:hypothetical protein